MVKAISLEPLPTNQVSELAQQASNLSQVNNKVNESGTLKEMSAPFSSQEKKDVSNAALEMRNAKEEEKAKQEPEELEAAFEVVADFMNLYNRNVNFSQDEQSEKTIIKVFDTDSQELIKQFPSEDLIKLAQKINGLRQDIDLKSGIFLDEKV
jgi:flagellar protein FlaG